LWEVTGNNLQKPSYIFGTKHLLCASDAKLSTNMQQVISNSDQIYFEVDMDDLGQLLSGFTAGTMKNDTTLKELFTEEEYQRVKTFLMLMVWVCNYKCLARCSNARFISRVPGNAAL
jgi:uncharacterized protein YbaP (TraB family)